MKQLFGALALVIAAFLSAPTAGADGTIADMVENTGAREMPFWAYLYDNGYGYLNSQQVYQDSKSVCVSRSIGTAESSIVQMLKARGYSTNEAQAIVIATGYSNSVHTICAN